MIEDLEALQPLLHDAIVRASEAAIDAGAEDIMKAVAADLGMSRAAMLRAHIHFKTKISAAEEHVEGAGVAFTLAWCAAEKETFRRVMAAITSPGAKGHEAEIVAALMRGDSVADAVAARQPQQSAEPVTREGNVVTLRPRGVTEASE